MHGYEIQRWMTDSRTDLWADVKPGSLYHALRQLRAEGLIDVVEVAARGDRRRTVYGITATGRRSLRALLRKGWERVPRGYPADLYTLVTFGDRLPGDEVRAHAAALHERVLEAIDEWTAGAHDKLAATGHDPIVEAMIRNGIAHLTADAELLERLAAASP